VQTSYLVAFENKKRFRFLLSRKNSPKIPFDVSVVSFVLTLADEADLPVGIGCCRLATVNRPLKTIVFAALIPNTEV